MLADMCRNGAVQPILSIWNLFEIGEATDKSQRARRLEFIDGLKPKWVAERVSLERDEIRRYLGPAFFGESYPSIVPFYDHLSKVDQLWLGGRQRIGLTPTKWIAGINYDRAQPLKDLAPQALTTLQAAGTAAVLERQVEIFDRWIRNLVPKTAPNGEALPAADVQLLIDFCRQNRDAFLTACRALAFEDAMTVARTNNPNRNPTRSDGIDLMHGVVALAYCDYFVCRDGYLRTCTELSRKQLAGASWAEVGSPDDIHALLRARGIP